MAHFGSYLSPAPSRRLESTSAELERHAELATPPASDGLPPSRASETISLSDDYAEELLEHVDHGAAQLATGAPTSSVGEDCDELRRRRRTGTAWGGGQPKASRATAVPRPTTTLNALLDALGPTTESLLMPMFDFEFLHSITYEQQVNAISLKLLPLLTLKDLRAFKFTPLTSLALDRCSLRIALEFLPSINRASFPNLAALSLSGVPLKFTPCALVTLVGLWSTLKHLDLSSTGASYPHVAHIAPLAESLTSLNLSGNPELDDDTLPLLGLFLRLKLLDLRGTRLTFEKLKELVMAGEDTMKELERIRVPTQALAIMNQSKLRPVDIPPLAPFVRHPNAVAALNEDDCAANLEVHGISRTTAASGGFSLVLPQLYLKQKLVDCLLVWREESRLVRIMGSDT